MKVLLREPLVHFLLIGAAMFLIFELLDDPTGPQSNQIVITKGQIEFLQASYTRSRQRTPSDKELQGLIDAYIREEILYREALALGLDKGDSVIRGRLRQKMELLSDDLASIVVPTKEQLQEYLDNNAALFTTEPQVAFQQIFIDTDKHGLAADSKAARILQLVVSGGKTTDPEFLGDRLMQPFTFPLTSVAEIKKLFGEPFSQRLNTLAPGNWVGPITSGYGLHIVFVTEKAPGKLPPLGDIRQAVEWEWTAAHQKTIQENMYKELRDNYSVVFEEQQKQSQKFQSISSAQAAEEYQ